jgi:FtsP/CotA-like multicopper oxidase with cupredoxin domain
MTHPVLLLGGLASLVVGLAGLVLVRPTAWPPAIVDLVRPAPAAVAPPWQRAATGQARTFRLTVGRTRWDLGGGEMVDAYAYDGTVPGPELRVTEGDTVCVTVRNTLAEPTTVHWHGVDVPVGMDGVPELSQAPIAPGGSFTYEFVATPADTRWYHSHVDDVAQQGGGLVGVLIIEPREAAAPTPAREYTLVTSEVVTGAAPTPQAAASGPAQGMLGMMGGPGGTIGSGAGQPVVEAFAVNGQTYPKTSPIDVRPGERVRLKLTNMS